jgi:hypothetical protein
MGSFEEREEGFEKRFAIDEALSFGARAAPQQAHRPLTGARLGEGSAGLIRQLVNGSIPHWAIGGLLQTSSQRDTVQRAP